MSFLTVIVPVYNVEKYIRRCVDSLISQELFDETEILLVDDGSKDKSGEICDEYSDKYEIIRSFHKPNGGLSDARNYGIERATGKYISFIDSDDLVAAGFFKDISDLISKYDADIINFNFAFEKTEGEFDITGDKAVTVRSREELIEDVMMYNIGNQVTCNVFRKDIFKDVRFPVGRAYEDIFTFYRLILNADKFIRVNYTYYVYNIVNDGSITKTPSVKYMRDMYEAVNTQCAALEKYLSEKGSHSESMDCYKLDRYIYIYLKLTRDIGVNDETRDFIKTLENDISKLKHCNLLKNKNYSAKKYIYYKATHLFR